MKAFVAFCAARPITTLTLHITITVLGMISLARLPLNSKPKSERPRISVVTPFPNASPEQVEEEVTRKVEEAMATLRGISNLSGSSEAGQSRVSASFEWGSDLDQIKLEVRERLARIKSDLPVEDLERIQIRGARFSSEATLRGRISAMGIDLSQNYELLEELIKKPLERVSGVARVEMDGVTPLEVQVTFRQDDLDRYGLNLMALTQLVSESNVDRSVGEIYSGGRVMRMRLVNAFRGIDDIRTMVINKDGLRLDQVANVRMKEGDLNWGRHLNRHYAVSVEVFKESTANTVEISRLVLDKIEEIKADPELDGIDLLIWDNEGQDIVDALDGLKNAGILGSIMALSLLFVFLWRVSATVLVGMAIPLSLLSALAWIYLMGRDLNVLTIVALMLGVGMLVDTAVVVVESIVRLTSKGMSTREAAVTGTMEVASPIFAATLTSIVVFLPVAMSKPSEMNDYIKEIGLVISLTLLASLFVSLTLIPMVAARIYRSGEKEAGAWFSYVRRPYCALLKICLGSPWKTIFCAAALISSVVLPVRWGFKLDVSDASELTKNVSIFYNADGSTDFRTMEEKVSQVEAALWEHKKELGFANVYSWYKDSFAWTAVYPADRQAGEAEISAMRGRVDKILPKIPGMTLRTGDWGMWRGGGSRSAGSIPVRVFGDSNKKIDGILEDLLVKLEGVAGVRSAERRIRDKIDEITVAPDEEILKRFDLSSSAVSRQLQAGFSNSFLQEMRGPNGEIRLRVAVDESEKDSLPELEDLLVDVTEEAHLPLSRLAQISEKESPGDRRREDRQSSGSISVSVDPAQMMHIRSELKNVLDQYEWPRGYSYDFGRGWRGRKRNQEDFTLGICLAIFLVYVIMACLFESLSQPFALLLTVVLAYPGVIWFLYLSGCKFDQPAAIGMILLVGIVVNNGIVFLDHVNRYRKDGKDIKQALMLGGEERLRPILITAITTIIGMCPIAFGDRAQAAGVYYDTLAKTIVGGLAVSTLLTLIVLPVVVYLMARFNQHTSSLIKSFFKETQTS